MKRLKIYELSLYDNLLRNIVLFVCSCIFAMSLSSVLYDSSENREILRMTKSSFMSDILYVLNESDSDEALIGFETQLDSLPYVEVVYNTNVKLAFDYKTNCSFDIDMWDIGLKSGQTISLTKGRMPEKANEIVLSEELSKTYRLGQDIALELTSFEDEANFDNWETDNVTVKVVGFFPSDAVLPKNYLTAQYMYATAADLFGPSNNKLTAYVCGLENNNGDILDFSFDTHSPHLASLVHIVDGTEAESVKEQLKTDLREYTIQIYTSKELRDNFLLSNRNTMLRFISKVLISLTVTVISFFSYVFLELIKKSREMTIYYLFGMSWREILIMNALTLFPGIAFGNIAGCLFEYYRRSHLLYTTQFHFSYPILCLLINIIVLIIIIIPLYIKFSMDNPIETLVRNPQ